jgi:protein gp37
MKRKANKDWWDFPYNPIKGCGFNPFCTYCYARRIVKRLGYAEKVADSEMTYQYGQHWPVLMKGGEHYELIERIKAFKPTFFEYVLAQKLRKKPTLYFFSMSDPAYWEKEWYERIVDKIARHMQHTFVVLTKQPEIYKKYTFPHNTILGITAINNHNLGVAVGYMTMYKHYLVTPLINKLLIVIEPVQEKIRLDIHGRNIEKYVDWLHIGIETGNRKGKYIPTRKEIEPFYNLDIPIFMKNSLAGITSRKLRQKFPDGVKE